MLKCDRVKSIGKNGAVCGVALAVALSCSPWQRQLPSVACFSDALFNAHRQGN